MTTYANAFRAEILRIARKEIKTELQGLRKTISSQRSDIAALKRDIKALSSEVKALNKASARQKPANSPDEASENASSTPRTRRGKFNAQTLTAKREQLGISQQAMAKLLGASSISVYKWESGKVTPRAAQLERIQAVLKMGKRAALAALQA